jgi:hypothetical protein
MTLRSFSNNFIKLSDLNKKLAALRAILSQNGISGKSVKSFIQKHVNKPEEELTDEDIVKLIKSALSSKLARDHKATKELKSDLVRVSDRKRLLLGVHREKGATKMTDIMTKIKKRLRRATVPFLGLRKAQRKMRYGMVQDVRKNAKKGYGK